jgi:dipeptidase D
VEGAFALVGSRRKGIVMSEAIKGLQPARVWEYFAEIAKIPRCSKNEAKMTEYVVKTAKKLGLEAKSDEVGNVIVRKPASPGKEKARSVCLQGHLDMVCEKNKEKVHDFAKDPIEIIRKGNAVMANGTTLGADNGIAIAMSLAIMEDKSLVHGPLEFLFTTDEETGLNGANNLAPGFVTSRTLINVDSEEEGALYVGCAGGRDTTGVWKVDFEDVPGGMKAAEVKVTGLRGGHSGLEINKGRGNAIKIIARVLLCLADMGAQLSSVEGGNKRNAIPRETEAKVFVPKKKWDEAAAAVAELAAAIKNEFKTTDPDIAIEFAQLEGGKKGKVIKKGTQRKILRTISGLPHGVMKMSPDIPGLVETSTNVAVIETGKKTILLATSQRSSIESEIEEICQTVTSILKLGGADVEGSSGYPGWKPNLDSTILKIAKSTYKSLHGKTPEVKAIHAGLECGIIGAKYPGMDMVSMGPTLEDVHSPGEKLYIDSVEKFWPFLLELLKKVD